MIDVWNSLMTKINNGEIFGIQSYVQIWCFNLNNNFRVRNNEIFQFFMIIKTGCYKRVDKPCDNSS